MLRSGKTLGSLVAVAVVAACALAMPASSLAASSVGIRGTVACPSGMPVVGVWVASSGGGSGFASLERVPGCNHDRQVQPYVLDEPPLNDLPQRRMRRHAGELGLI